MTLPRLLEENRVEVRLVAGCTHVMRAEEIQNLIAHLTTALGLLAPKGYGCHCDLEEGQAPDSCLLDEHDSDGCMYGRRLVRLGKGRDDCECWKPIL